MDLQQFFSKKGYDISGTLKWQENIDIWKSWYKGKVKKFHSYYVYNGDKKVRREKKSLQMAKKVCEDWADLLFNEKVSISLSNKKSTEKLEKILKKNKSYTLINQGIEKSFALGLGAIVCSIQDMNLDENDSIDYRNARVKMEFVSVKKIYPLTWENDVITECAFVTNKYKHGVEHIYISMHILGDNGNYIIQNYEYKKGKGTDLIELSEEENNKEDYLAEFDTESNTPWFTFLKPNICNNIDEDTPFGISVFGNSIDVLKSIDTDYTGIDDEVVLGKRRIFISEEMMSFDKSGTQKMTFDPEDISIYRLPKEFNKDKMIEHSNEDLRTDKLIDTVNFQLNILSSKSGFGQERYKFDGKNVQTATGVISENSDMFRVLKKHENTLEDSLIELITACAYISTHFLNEKIDVKDIKIAFDDSIIEDKGAEQTRASIEVGNGTRSKKSYMKDIRNLSDQEIKEEFENIESEKQEDKKAMGFIFDNPEKEKNKKEDVKEE